METKFNFNSAICTSREQSERLLALGLKKETADMWYPHFAKTCPLPLVDEVLNSDDLPAWSLHRLIDMADTTRYINEVKEDEQELWFCMDKCYCRNNRESFCAFNLYDSILDCIEWLIKEGYFNKEYLV